MDNTLYLVIKKNSMLAGNATYCRDTNQWVEAPDLDESVTWMIKNSIDRGFDYGLIVAGDTEVLWQEAPPKFTEEQKDRIEEFGAVLFDIRKQISDIQNSKRASLLRLYDATRGRGDAIPLLRQARRADDEIVESLMNTARRIAAACPEAERKAAIFLGGWQLEELDIPDNDKL